MTEFINLAMGMVLLITLLGCIPYAVWVLYTMWKRNWVKVRRQLLVPVMIWAGLMVVSWSTHAWSRRQDLKAAFDAPVRLGDALYEYHSERYFNGDGYSFSVYELPSEVRQRFEKADARLFAEFPRRPSYRKHWFIQTWQEAPSGDLNPRHLDFALSGGDASDAPALRAHYRAIREALSRKGTFYASFYSRKGDVAGDIDFFLVDLNGGRLYLINQNT